MGDGARRAIMDGAIVRQAIDSASKALPTLELFKNLQSLIADYPSSDTLRKSLLDHLHARLAEALPCDAAAVTLRATRGLTLTSGSAEDAGRGGLVDALQRANEEMVAALDADLAEGCPRDELAGAYAQFVEEWCGKEEIDAHLYAACRRLSNGRARRHRAGSFLPRMFVCSSRSRRLPCPPAAPGRILRIARRYTCSTPTDTGVWLARLHAESVHGTADSVNEAWTSARRAVRMSSEIWLWGADRCCPSSSESSGSWEAIDSLLAESMREGELREVHEALLLRVAERIGTLTRATERRERVEHVARRCLPSARVWARVFGAVSGGEKEGEDEEGLVREVYEYWRGTGEEEEATLGFARWLLFEKRRGEEALRLISVAGGGTAVRTRWARIVRLGTAESGEIRKDGETRSV
ncbi:hypothetical protein F5148DRAFT_1172554 [Russula earlei]|uniref:Uncharacterized protein n=1 Tax=Russula earlei TaxID=71964 RepID=A0ACC0UI22_9AGAM|nr:hypothetical protein F5148DRAFT_1172554 [Russula earlei]